MLKSMKIRNFQRVVNDTIEFDPNVTVLVGGNDRGKSARIRALRWVCLNRPSGKAFIRHGSKKAEVLLKFDTHKVKRVAGKGVNTYSLDGKLLKSFKSAVPDPIADKLKVQPINFQRQNEDWFWFSLSPGQVTKELNKLLDLSTLDKYQVDLTRQLRDAKIQLAAVESRIRDETEEINKWKWLGQPSAAMAAIAARAAGAVAAGRECLAVGELASEARRAASVAVRAAGGLAGAAQLLGLSRAVQASGNARTGLCGAVAGLESAIGGLSGLAGLPEPPKPPDSGVMDAINEAAAAAREIQILDSQIAKAEKRLEDAMEGSCPVCGSDLKLGE